MTLLLSLFACNDNDYAADTAFPMDDELALADQADPTDWLYSPERLAELSFEAMHPDAQLLTVIPTHAPEGSLLLWDLGADGSWSMVVTDNPELPLIAWESAMPLDPEEDEVDLDQADWFHMWPGDPEQNIADRLELEADMMVQVGTCSGNAGTWLDSYQGISAYSNGSNSSCMWHQCVEYIDRFHAPTRNHYGNANTYANGLAARKMKSMVYFGNNTTANPRRGDVVVSTAKTYGHVGVLKTVTSTQVEMIDQNRSTTDATTTFGRSGKYLADMMSGYGTAGWLRPGVDFGSSFGDSTSGLSYGWTTAGLGIDTAYTGAVKFRMNTDDPRIASPAGLNVDGDLYTQFFVRMKAGGTDNKLRIYYTSTCNGQFKGWQQAQSVEKSYKDNGTWRSETVDMSNAPNWKGCRIDQVRIDPAGAKGGWVVIDKAWFKAP